MDDATLATVVWVSCAFCTMLTISLILLCLSTVSASEHLHEPPIKRVDRVVSMSQASCIASEWTRFVVGQTMAVSREHPQIVVLILNP